MSPVDMGVIIPRREIQFPMQVVHVDGGMDANGIVGDELMGRGPFQDGGLHADEPHRRIRNKPFEIEDLAGGDGELVGRGVSTSSKSR